MQSEIHYTGPGPHTLPRLSGGDTYFVQKIKGATEHGFHSYIRFCVLMAPVLSEAKFPIEKIDQVIKVIRFALQVKDMLD